MSDSPFEPPEVLAEATAGSWSYLVARGVVALGVVAYSALLGGFGVLYALAIMGVVLVDDSVPSNELRNVLIMSASLASIGVVGLGCAAVLVCFRKIALPALLVFAVYATLGVLPVAGVQFWDGQSLARAAQVISMGSLVPMLCVMAFGILRLIRDAR